MLKGVKISNPQLKDPGGFRVGVRPPTIDVGTSGGVAGGPTLPAGTQPVSIPLLTPPATGSG